MSYHAGLNVSVFQDYKMSKASELKVEALSGVMWDALNKRISVIVTDASGAIIHVNEKFSDISGYQISEVIGRNQRLLNSGFHPKTFFQGMWQDITAGKTWIGDVCNVNKSGIPYWVSTQIFPLSDKNGRISHFLALQSDITQDKERAIKGLEEAERLNAAIEGTGAGSWDWDIVTGQKIINDRWAQILGFEVSEIKAFGIDAFKALTHPDDYHGMEAKLEHHLRGESDRYSCELRMRHKNGSWIWIHDRGKVIKRDANGRALRMCGTHTDITERKYAQELASKRSNLVNAIVQGIPEGIASFSAEGELLASNPPYQKLSTNKSYGQGVKLKKVFQEELDRYLALGAAGENANTAKKKRLISEDLDQYYELSSHILQDGGVVQIVQDISEYQRGVRNLKKQRKISESNIQYLSVIINNIPYGISVFDSNDLIRVWNDRYIDIFGMRRGELRRGKSFSSILKCQKDQGNFPGDCKEYLRNIKSSIDDSREYIAHATVNGRNIRSVHVAMPDGGWVGIHQDITEFDKLLAKASYDAEHDQLTSLLNRVGFSNRLEKAIEHCKKNGKFLYLMFIDLDGFKAINDTMGHAMGDLVLKNVARRLNENTRSRDTIGRLGGDEFAIFFVDDGIESDSIKAFAERITDLVSRSYSIKGRHLKIGASIGISEFPNHAMSAADLILSADMAMYCVKRGAKGTYSFYDEKIRSEIIRRRKIEYALSEMDKDRELSIHYQPIVRACDFSVAGYEALARWHNADLGHVSPGEFIPIAENSGAINDIGAWIARGAINRRRDGCETHFMAINVSTVQLRDHAFSSKMRDICLFHGVSPSSIEIEVTESVIIGDNFNAVDNLRNLKEIGFKIALDDFGTGYSSLSYLNKFAFDKLKIDRTFVRNMLLNDGSMAIVKSIVGMAKALGLAVTAEGVETEAAANKLKAIGVDFLQGFYFG